MDITISVALATYNGEKYLLELLNSLANQTYLPYELVISDDNSTDNTLKIAREFSQTAPFKINIIENKEQLGVIKNFATAFANTTGKLIAYCDQDDIWHPEKLEKSVQYFSDPEVKLAMHRSEVVNEKLQPLGYCIPERREVEIGKTAFPSSIDMTYGLGHQMLFDREMYQDYAWIFDSNYSSLQPIAENYDYLIRFLAGMNGSVITMDETLVKFRRHETATSDAGLNDKNTEAVSGFLGKKSTDYTDQANEFSNISKTIDQYILGKMKKYEEKLKHYNNFLKRRAQLIHTRATIYNSNSLLKRLLTYAKLLTKSVYTKKSNGGFGYKALLVDLFVACCSLKGAQKIIALKSSLRN